MTARNELLTGTFGTSCATVAGGKCPDFSVVGTFFQDFGYAGALFGMFFLGLGASGIWHGSAGDPTTRARSCWPRSSAIFLPIMIRAGFMPPMAWVLYFVVPTWAGISIASRRASVDRLAGEAPCPRGRRPAEGCCHDRPCKGGRPMPDRGRSIALQQVSIGDYREAVLDLIHERCGSAFAIWCGRDYFEPTTRTAVTYPGPITLVDNVFLWKRRLVWQRGVIRPLLAADVAIIELNPRILSNWLILAGRRLRRRPTVLWGHAWSRSGARSRTDRVRDVMRRLGNVILVYTERQKERAAGLSAGRPRRGCAQRALSARRHRGRPGRRGDRHPLLGAAGRLQEAAAAGRGVPARRVGRPAR